MTPEADTGAPTHIGPYRILDSLGEGGMGTVYLAEQHSPVKRRVALKLIKLGMDSRAVVNRFEQERQALALMDHEGIAKVFDCGTSDRGQPFFVMELVKGIPLHKFCEQQKLSLEQRIKLMQQVCIAVQHAHQKGVVHRDLKPGNVLVSDDDGRAQVKIIDFGLAKAMGQKLVEATMFTEVGQIVGTPEYMAPEQADPTNQDIDTRADIYSLGVMLYQVLVGELPFPSSELREKGILEVQRVLREVDPPKPSTRLTRMGDASTELARTRRITLSALRKALKTDLDWVVLKALEKERNRRYDTANALAADLQRFLDHEPLVAGPPSATYRLKKLVRRYRGQVIAGSLVLLALIGGGVGTFYEYLRAEEKAAEALEQKGKAEANEKLANDKAAEALREKRRADDKVREFDLLAGVVLHERVLENEKMLYPARPRQINAMERWLEEDAGALLAMLPEIERTITDLEGRELTESQRFLRKTLVELKGKLAMLEAHQKAGVERRLEWARNVQQLSLAHPNARHTWGAVRASIVESEKYAGRTIELRDEDITGLVPIGKNPKTGLWEFYDLRSAWDGKSSPREIPIPTHDDDGGIPVTGETGIVFVLLPGGDVMLGSQANDPGSPFFDQQSQDDETLHEVSLAPFFLARHEMTQGQWARLWTWNLHLQNPSRHKILVHPVEQVTWSMCETLVNRHGMVMPTEAQWEYGCRGGSTTAWSVEWADLKTVANVADGTAKAVAAAWQCESWNDGWVFHAPVGTFAPNGFGLYDVHGNVWEWCWDWFGFYGAERPLDGLRTGGEGDTRVVRGGGFHTTAAFARSAERYDFAPRANHDFIGLRPARTLRR